MRLGDILTTASGNLGRNKMRTLLTITAIFIGTLTLTLTNGVGSGIGGYIDSQLGNLGAKDILVIQPGGDDGLSLSGGENDAPKKYDPDRKVASVGRGFAQPILTNKDLDKLAQNKKLSTLTPLLSVTPDYIKVADGQEYQITVSSYISGTNLDMVSGVAPSNDSAEYQIVLPYNYPDTLGFSDEEAVGKEIVLGVSSALGDKSEVVAIVTGVQQKSLMGLAGASINDALTKKLFDLQSKGLPASSKEQYQAVTAKFDINLSDKQVTDLKAELKDMGYLAQTVADRIGILKQVINGIVVVFNLFGLIALIAATFGIVNTLLMAVAERTKEIGLMKSMGMSGGKIFLLFSAEAALLGFWGSVLGTGVAIGLGAIINHVASKGFLSAFPGLHLLAFPIVTVGGIILLIIAIAFLAGVLPAVRAARKNPIEALRYE